MLGLSVEQTRVYQEAKEEGRLEGLVEGELRGKLQAVLRMLARGFSPEEVADLLGLEVEQVRQAVRSAQN